jgi:plastocyanin
MARPHGSELRARRGPGALHLAALAACLVVAGGCGYRQPPPTPAAGTVSMIEYTFRPKHLTVKAGITITVRNDGQIAHNLTIVRNANTRSASPKLAGTSTFLPGRSERLKIALEPGRYAMVCTVPGHRQLGMIGTVTVER